MIQMNEEISIHQLGNPVFFPLAQYKDSEKIKMIKITSLLNICLD